MTPKGRKNTAASVRDRLLELARRRGEDFQLILTRYGLERFLYRLSQSGYRDRFILKGAMLFAPCVTQPSPMTVSYCTLTACVLTPASWKGTLVQYAGRLHRLHPGKREVRIVDYVDSKVPMLARMFERPRIGYRAMGYREDKSGTFLE